METLRHEPTAEECAAICNAVEFHGMQEKCEGAHGGVLGFRSPQILGCYVTKFAPHKALKLIA